MASQGRMAGDVMAARPLAHTAVHQDGLKPAGPPWWLWGNVLNADAPVVAGLWAVFLARADGIQLRSVDAVVLMAVVWVVYASDRLLDGRRGVDSPVLKERHRFSAAHRTLFVVLIVAASAGALLLVKLQFSLREVVAGAALGILVAGYMVCVHSGGQRVARLLPKELVVGMIFATGTTLPLWSQPPRPGWTALITWGLFACLCSLNCLGIECWENGGAETSETSSQRILVNRVERYFNSAAISLALLCLLACLWPGVKSSSRCAELAIAAAAALTAVLHAARKRMSPPQLRVLADVALAAPAVVGILISS